MNLKKLLENFPFAVEIKGKSDVGILGLSDHSKNVGPGFVFFARRGKNYDGNEYVEEAYLAGARVIVSDMYNPFLSKEVTQVIVPDITLAACRFSDVFFELPADKLYTIGITGTAGKTTTTCLIRHLYGSDRPLAMSTTIERRIGELSFPSSLTTPNQIELQKFFFDAAARQMYGAVLEVTSHSLMQNRLGSVRFDQALFLNLSPEHLDFHHTMDAYFAAKQRLLDALKPGAAIIYNADCPYMRTMKREGAFSFGSDPGCDLSGKVVQESEEGVEFILSYSGNRYEGKAPLIGAFNFSNVMAALSSALISGYALETLLSRLMSFEAPRGRLERVPNTKGTIFVDYAHKPEALREVLLSLGKLRKRRLIVLFGCGGDRDRQKRPVMGKVAEELADVVIVTSDNPRRESPKAIIDEILMGMSGHNAIVIEDRRAAILKGVHMMEEGDILLIAGRGHARQQQVHGNMIPLD